MPSTSRLAEHPVLGEMFSVYSTAKFVVRMIRARRTLQLLGSYKHPEPSDGTVVFNLGSPYNLPLLIFEGLLATKLAEYRVGAKVLLNDIGEPYRDGMEAGNYKKSNDMRLRERLVTKLLGRDKSDLFLPYSKMISTEELAELHRAADQMIAEGQYVYAQIDLEPYVTSSIVRYYRSATSLVETERNYTGVRRAFVRNALLSAFVAEKVDKSLNPRMMVSSHGIYATWGPFYQYFRQRKRRFGLYGFSGLEVGAASLSTQGVTLCEYDGGLFRLRHRTEDPEPSRATARSIMEGRLQGHGRDLGSHWGDDAERQSAKGVLESLGDAEAVAIFPGVLWEGRGPESRTIFSGRVDWLIRTVRLYMNRPEKLIVRAHPAEVHALRCRQGVQEVLRSEFGDEIFSHPNIIFVPASVQMRSYDLFDGIKAGIVYDGTIGLEMMYAGIPVLLAGRSVYSELPFSFQSSTWGDYVSAVDNWDAVRAQQEEHRGMLESYLEYYFRGRFVKSDAIACAQRFSDGFDDPRAVLDDSGLVDIAETMLGLRPFFGNAHRPVPAIPEMT